MVRDFGQGVLLVAVDAKEQDTLVGIRFVQLRQTRHVGIVDGALRAKEQHNHRFVVFEIRNLPGFTGNVFDVELGDLFAEVGRALASMNHGGHGDSGNDPNEKRSSAAAHRSVLEDG